MKTYKAWLIHNEEALSEWVPADVAQELYEALRDLIDRPFKSGTRPGDAQRHRARAAMRKARGES